MSNSPSVKPDSKFPELATRDDVISVFGEIDDAILTDILHLQPTVEDLERASLWLGGDPDVFGAERALQHPASAIVTILTADEEDESRRH